MFTGIVEGTVVVTKLEKNLGLLKVKPSSSSASFEFSLGDSVSINGCCLSITEFNSQWTFFVSRETFAKTNLQYLGEGDVVNFEQALRVGDRLGGHWVTGHVDATATVHSLDSSSEDWLYRFALKQELGKYLVDKGSICINGVSLTVNALEDKGELTFFDCTVVPVTQDFTNFSQLQPTDIVNIEVDILAKHLERLNKFC